MFQFGNETEESVSHFLILWWHFGLKLFGFCCLSSMSVCRCSHRQDSSVLLYVPGVLRLAGLAFRLAGARPTVVTKRNHTLGRLY